MRPANFGRALLLVVVLLTSGRAAVASNADVPTFEDLIAPSTRTHDESCALMAAWVAAHANDPRAPRGLIWMGQLRIADHQSDPARALFQRVRHDFPNTEWALHAEKGLADLDLQSRHYGRAIARYDRLARSEVPFFAYLGKMGAAYARAERLRFSILVALGISFIALWTLRLFTLRRSLSWRTLWPPPLEVLYPLPILLLLASASFGMIADEARGLRLLAIGATLVLWLNGIAWRVRPPAGRWRIVHALFGIGQAAALLYAVVILSGLWEKFHDTLVMGAE